MNNNQKLFVLDDRITINLNNVSVINKYHVLKKDKYPFEWIFKSYKKEPERYIECYEIKFTNESNIYNIREGSVAFANIERLNDKNNED